jgi:endoglucanase
LLTRAEEVGFVGAIAAVLRPTLLRRSDRVISIECSAEQPFARQDDGVILRVGDRMSIFDSDFMYFLNQQAKQFAKRDASFKFQRALMPGGACEGSVFNAYGYTTGAACVPLGNYHNMNRQTKTLAAEYVDVNDWKNMVKLFVYVARNAHKYEPGFIALKKRVESRFRKYARLLRLSSSPPGETRRGTSRRVNAAAAERVTADDAFESAPTAAKCAVFLDRVDRVLAARGREAALAAEELAERGSVENDQLDR